MVTDHQIENAMSYHQILIFMMNTDAYNLCANPNSPLYNTVETVVKNRRCYLFCKLGMDQFFDLIDEQFSDSGNLTDEDLAEFYEQIKSAF